MQYSHSVSYYAIIPQGEVGSASDGISQAAKSGFQREKFRYATFILSQSFQMQLALSTQLETLVPAMRDSYAGVNEPAQLVSKALLQLPLQFALNLQSDSCNWANLLLLSGEMMNEETYPRLRRTW